MQQFIDVIPFSVSFFIYNFLLFVSFIVIVFLFLKVRNSPDTFIKKSNGSFPETEDLFFKTYNNGPVAYLVVDSDGKISLPNTATLRLFNYSESELKKISFVNLFSVGYKDEAKTYFHSVIKGVPVENIEIKIQKKDKSEVLMCLSVIYVEASNKLDMNMVVGLLEISEKKNVERSKTDFISLASHQLRTPLSAVKWHIEMLLTESSGKVNPKQREYLQKIYNGNEQMIKLVGILLKVAKIEMGLLTAKFEEVDVVRTAFDSLEEFSTIAIRKKIKIVKHFDNTVSFLESDQELLKLIITNLISNAVNYTPEEGTVRLELKKIGSNLHIIVSDTGFGIPKDQQKRIFTRLYRSNEAKKAITAGSGLDLFIVKASVEALSGSISFESEVNKGTTFTVVLPL